MLSTPFLLFFSGPLNTIAVHPKGKAFASGGEDGYVRVHWVSLMDTSNHFCSACRDSDVFALLTQFDESYFRARPYGNLEPEE